VHVPGIDLEQSLDVGFGLAGNSNDRVRHLECSLLNPKREIVTTSELFALPRSKRFQRVNRDHERNAVILFRQNPAEMAVPSMTVHEIGIDVRCVEIGTSSHCTKNGAQRLWAGEFARINFEAGNLEIAFLQTLIAKATNLHRHDLCQFARKKADVN